MRSTLVVLTLFIHLHSHAQHTALTVPTGHLSSPNKISVSSNGKWMASSDHNHIIIWNAISGAQLRNIQVKNEVQSLSWFPDNKTLAVMTEAYPVDSIFKLNITTGERSGKSLSVNDAYRMKVSRDGRYFLVSGKFAIRVLDSETGQQVQFIAPDNKKLQLTIFTTPDEKYCAAMDFTKISVNLLDPGIGGSSKTAKEVWRVKPPFGEIRRYAFSPDSKNLVALLGPDFGMVCFDIGSGDVKWSVKSNESFDDFGFTADGQNIIVLHERLIETYTLNKGLKFGNTIRLPDRYGSDMIVSGGMAYLWDEWNIEYRITRYNPLTGLSDRVFAGDFQKGDNAGIAQSAPVFAQFAGKAPLRIWNFMDGRVIQSISMDDQSKCIGISGNGKIVIYGKPLQVRDTQTGELKFNLPYDVFYSPDGIAVSATGKWVATFENSESNVMLFDTASKQRVWKKADRKPNGALFSTDESMLAVSYIDGEVRVFGVPDGNIISIVNGSKSEVHPPAGMAFKGNDEIIVASGSQISSYHISTGNLIKKIYTLPDNTNSFIQSFKLAEDRITGMLQVANSPTQIRILNLNTGDITSTLPGHTGGTYFTGLLKGGTHLLSTGADDLTKLWDTKTGKELIQLYAFNNEWLAVNPDGRFDGSRVAIEKLHFIRGTDVLPLQNLYEQYYTPGLITRVIEGERFDPVSDIDNVNKLPQVKIFYKSATRNLEVSDDIASYPNTTGSAEITVRASCPDDKIQEIRLYQNGKIVSLTTRNMLVVDQDSDPSEVSSKFNVQLLPGENIFKAIALNSQRSESNPDLISVIFLSGTPDNNADQVNNTIYHADIDHIDPNGQLFLIVVGINAYQNPSMTLNYALADATAFKDELEKDAKSIISNIKTYFVTDNEANKAGFETALNAVKQNARAQDVFVFYYAGHGVIGKDKEFYLVPNDVSDLKNVQAELEKKGLPAKLLQKYAIEIAAQKQLFILDACQSAGAFNEMLSAGGDQQKSIAVVSRTTGTHWMAASGAQQFANEFSQLGHGAFTYVLLEALKGSAATDKMITVNGLKNYLQLGVPELMKKYSGTLQYPASYGFGNDFPVEVIK